MIRKLSEGFWRSDNKRFDILRVTKDGHHGSVSSVKYVVYDAELGKRTVFTSLAEAFAHCESATAVVPETKKK